MHEHHEDDPEILNEIEKLGYDPRDVPIEKTWKHAVALFVSCFAVMLFAALFMKLVDQYQGSKSVGNQPLQERQFQPEKPYPLLQSNRAAKHDINDLRTLERFKTDEAGWVDKSAGIAHIPVEEAKRLVLKEGLPVSSVEGAPHSVTGEDPASPGTVVPPMIGGGQQ